MSAEVYLNDKQLSKPLLYPIDKYGEHPAVTVEAIRLINLQHLIKEAGGPARAAELLEMERSQLSQIAGRNPTRNIGSDMARRIETAWGKPKGWLDREQNLQLGLEQPKADYNTEPGPALPREVPLISWVQAGQWRDVIDNLQPGDAYKRIPTTVKVGPAAYALRIVGDSMTNPHGSPSFPEGTVIILDPEREAAPNKYVVVRQRGDTEVTFKQLVRDGGRYYLKPLNPRYPILEMADDAVICGVLVQAVMDF